MRLADFIETNLAEIVGQAEGFAKTMGPAAQRLDGEALRDHIPDMLNVIVADLRTPQTSDEAKIKSEGKFAPASDATRTAAQTHAGTRALQGFDIVQMVSEYRVLRATVLRLWTEDNPDNGSSANEIQRFNEGVDQAIAESVGFFAAEMERWRNVFLGILGHELRGPLSAILLATEVISGMNMDTPIAKNVARIVDGGERMRALLDDLLDFNRASFGLGILIDRKPTNLAQACANEIELVRTNWPEHDITFSSSGDVDGSFDESRVREVVWNLITNAAKYGAKAEPIAVHLEGSEGGVRLSVRNGGPNIPIAEQAELFEPLRRASVQDAASSSLGLGLFIVRQVAIAHGGEVELRSDEGSTEFAVVLRREPGAMSS